MERYSFRNQSQNCLNQKNNHQIMKKTFSKPGNMLALTALLLFAVMWAVWFFGYRYFLIWLEGYSYFSTLPDFASLYKEIPEGLPGYLGAFLHQFYKWPAVGAAIQAFFAVWPIVCIGVTVIRLFKEPARLLWIAFLILPVFVYRQFWDMLLYKSVLYSLVSTGIMLTVLIATMIKRPRWAMPKLMTVKILNPVVMVAAVALSVYFLAVLDRGNKEQEQLARLEYLGEHRQWNEILKSVTVNDSWENELKRHYVLIALSETGQLPDHAFRYGLQGASGFIFYDNVNPLALNCNALFYECLDMHNAVIHQAYQQGVQTVPGVGFSSLRRLADTYIKLKDYTLAKKYVDILSHSTCHKAWVKERLPKLESIRNEQPAYIHDEYKATISDFTHTISSMVDRYRDNKKYADLLLCSLLADEEGDKFKNLFRYIAQVQYPDGTSIPRLYEEALVLISMVDPSVIQGYTISQDTIRRFNDYVALMNAGRGNQALKKYADTYWAYSYRAN